MTANILTEASELTCVKVQAEFIVSKQQLGKNPRTASKVARVCQCVSAHMHIYLHKYLSILQELPLCYCPHCGYTGSQPLPCLSKLSCPNITAAANKGKLFKTWNKDMPETLEKKSNIIQDYTQKEVNMLENTRTEIVKPGYPY